VWATVGTEDVQCVAHDSSVDSLRQLIYLQLDVCRVDQLTSQRGSCAVVSRPYFSISRRRDPRRAEAEQYVTVAG